MARPKITGWGIGVPKKRQRKPKALPVWGGAGIVRGQPRATPTPITPTKPFGQDYIGDQTQRRAASRLQDQQTYRATVDSVRGKGYGLRLPRLENRISPVEEGVLGRPYGIERGLPVFIGERWNRGTNQTITTATTTEIQYGSKTFSSERLGYPLLYDSSTYTWTIPASLPGIWQISGLARFDSNATGFRYVRVYLNDATVIYHYQLDAGDTEQSLPIIVQDYFDEGDTFQVQVRQNSGGDLDLIGSSENVFLSVEYRGVH
jgi:hypothetical protein